MCGLIYELKDAESELSLNAGDGASAAATPTRASPSTTVMKMVSTLFRVALFLLLVAPFFFIKRPSAAGTPCISDSAVFCLLLVVLQGQALISGMRFSKSCYALLLALLAGVVATSYDGLGSGNGDHDDPLLYKLLVCFLSLFLVLLCGVYLCHRASETSQPPLAHPPQAATVSIV